MDVDILKNIFLFESLTEEELEKIAGIIEKEEFSEGSTVFKEGDKGEKFYIIYSGSVRVSQSISGTGEEALTILEKGNFFGEMALIDDAPRSADLIVHEQTELLVISKKNFDDLLFFDKDIAYKILWAFVRTFSSRLRETNEKIKAFLHMAGNF